MVALSFGLPYSHIDPTFVTGRREFVIRCDITIGSNGGDPLARLAPFILNVILSYRRMSKPKVKRKRHGGKFAERAFEVDLQRAQDGNIRNMSRVGIHYLTGYGTKPDAENALYWLKEAAGKDEPYALKALGEMYLNGEGVPIEPNLYLSHLLKADTADKNQARLMDRLDSAARRDLYQQIAASYQSGIGCEPDSTLAAEWSARAEAVRSPVEDGSADLLLDEILKDTNSPDTIRAAEKWKKSNSGRAGETPPDD